MGEPKWNPSSQSVYDTLKSRLLNLYRIDIEKYIDHFTYKGIRLGQGFSFYPKDHAALKSKLTYPQFALDDSRYFCDQMAALATQGTGYREVGVPSLHIAISKSRVNVHLDKFGFVAIGPDGKKYYNAEAVQHIVDELGFGFVVEWLDKSNNAAAKQLGAYLSRVHPVLPNAKNKYRPAVGAQLDLKVRHDPTTGEETESFNFQVDHSLTGETRFTLNYTLRFHGIGHHAPKRGSVLKGR